MAYESAQGMTFKFSGKEFLLTSVSFNKKVSETDVSTLQTKHGEFRTYRPAPLRDGDELSIEFYGMEFPQMTATGALVFTMDNSGTNSALVAALPTVALCTSCSLQAAAGDLIKGSATMRITQS
ncbi:MAG: hypothetical protein EBR52_08055 [Microbacteriaceae bacterium]|nr:hypothetical protein [Microbacteriaceae bacterium]